MSDSFKNANMINILIAIAIFKINLEKKDK